MARPKLREERITMAHGAGGKASQTLVSALFLEAFRNPVLERLQDQAVIEVGGQRLAFTTDTFVVSPLFFPGGDIGKLAVHGTVNDLAVGGARPLFLSAGFVLEEGFPVAELRRIASSMAAAAAQAGVQIVTGDTKVVERGKADGCYLNTAGLGIMEGPGSQPMQAGDAVLVSGPIGDHGVTVMLARGELELVSDLQSDTASLYPICQALQGPGLRCMRDATRGGVATVLNELAVADDLCVALEEGSIPVRQEVRGACELLGIDPLYVACEGRLVAVLAADDAERALAAVRAVPGGEQAALVGRIQAEPPGRVLLRTAFGGTRIVDVLVGDPLPRIC